MRAVLQLALLCSSAFAVPRSVTGQIGVRNHTVPDWFVQQTSNEDGNPLAAWFANHVGKDTRRVRK